MFPWLLIAVVIVAALINRQTTKGRVSVAHEHPGEATEASVFLDSKLRYYQTCWLPFGLWLLVVLAVRVMGWQGALMFGGGLCVELPILFFSVILVGQGVVLMAKGRQCKERVYGLTVATILAGWWLWLLVGVAIYAAIAEV